MCICIYIYIYVYMHIYIYIYGEREREGESYVSTGRKVNDGPRRTSLDGAAGGSGVPPDYYYHGCTNLPKAIPTRTQ